MKGVVIEFDFAAMDGAELLYRTTQNFLRELDNIELDVPTEIRYLAGTDYLDGFERLFASVKTKKGSDKAARDLAALFNAELTRVVPTSVRPSFVNFVNALSSNGVKVAIATRAGLDAVRPAFESVLKPGLVELYRNDSIGYGSVAWDFWRRACNEFGLTRFSTIGIAGSGFSVKSALSAGIGCVGVSGPHVSYQDYTGASLVIEKLDAASSRRVLSVLRT